MFNYHVSKEIKITLLIRVSPAAYNVYTIYITLKINAGKKDLLFICLSPFPYRFLKYFFSSHLIIQPIYAMYSHRKMFTNEEAKHLLELPKILDRPDMTIDLREENTKLNMHSNDEEWRFVFEIYSNKRISFRINLHHQEDNTKEGLLRIDYKQGAHKNPETVNEFVPAFLQSYAGKWFYNEPHIHMFVESYKFLAWAMPLKDYNRFPIKEINSAPDFSRAIRAFAKEINLVSKFSIQEAIL